MQLKVDDIGVYFKWVVKAANPEPSTLSVEVSTTMHNTLALLHRKYYSCHIPEICVVQ